MKVCFTSSLLRFRVIKPSAIPSTPQKNRRKLKGSRFYGLSKSFCHTIETSKLKVIIAIKQKDNCFAQPKTF